MDDGWWHLVVWEVSKEDDKIAKIKANLLTHSQLTRIESCKCAHLHKWVCAFMHLTNYTINRNLMKWQIFDFSSCKVNRFKIKKREKMLWILNLKKRKEIEMK